MRSMSRCGSTTTSSSRCYTRSEKTVVGDHVQRKWDQAQTPFERLKATGILSPEQRQRLPALYEQTNPRHLREEIYRQLTHLWQQSFTPAESAA